MKTDFGVCSSGTGFDGEGSALVGFFDFDSIEGEPGSLADAAGISLEAAAAAIKWLNARDRANHLAIAADFLSRVFSQIIPESGPIHLDLLGTKILSLYFLLGRGGGLTALASRSGKSKQLLSHHARLIEDLLVYHGAQQKRVTSRETYAAAARNSWAALSPEERRLRRAGYKKEAASSLPEAADDDARPGASSFSGC
jgi:hypothetical protein